MPAPERDELFARLRDLHDGISWEKLAPQLNTTPTQLGRWRRGESPMNYEATVELLGQAGYLKPVADAAPFPDVSADLIQEVRERLGDAVLALTRLEAALGDDQEQADSA